MTSLTIFGSTKPNIGYDNNNDVQMLMLMIKAVQIKYLSVIGAWSFNRKLPWIDFQFSYLFFSPLYLRLVIQTRIDRMAVGREKIKSLINQTMAGHPTRETKVKKNKLQMFLLIDQCACVLVSVCVCVCVSQSVSLLQCYTQWLLVTLLRLWNWQSKTEFTICTSLHTTYFECIKWWWLLLFILHITFISHARDSLR